VKKIVQINTVRNGSTGSIMMKIHNKLLSENYESYVDWGRGSKSRNKNEICMNDKLGVYFHVIYARLTGRVGFASKKATLKLLKKLDYIKPDIIHLHNIHGYYINIELLFNYIKKNNIKVVWTLHDCWSFTGHCTHFETIQCKKWKKGCKDCQLKYNYPKSFIDSSSWCFFKKKNLFTKDLNITIVTPCEWLKNMVEKSFFKNNKIIVINNGVDKKKFRKLEPKKLLFKEKYNLKDKTIILGVAFPWTIKKGLNIFYELSQKLSKEYKIVMVGLSKHQLKKIPKNIIGFGKIDNIDMLVDLYNSADVFLNPTYEDTYPTTNLEAIECGTPIIGFNSGGTAETIKKYGIITKNKNVDSIIEALNFLDLVKKNGNVNSVDEMLEQYLKMYEVI